MSPQNSKLKPTERAKREISPIVNVRIPHADKEIIRQAAAACSSPVATFIRAAAVARAREMMQK